ncbi:MAG: histidine--tRNA ligase [Bacteroidia bacterium]|nr:histidine--tRNA ligase [Bacteroidia bacterium]NNJ56770.1 histidine--tRNA ligase [Bacteroidia bacterium]
MQKPSNPQGTRDFGPEVMRKRNYILNTIRAIFEKFGFEQLETPALENLSMLTGKYGDEGDKLLYKIRSNKEITQEISEDEANQIRNMFPDKWIAGESKLGLRYDLTVPFARFVVQHRNELTFPFRRYQIQPVWRADRPQKGRFREFTQCDADCIGTNSLLNEADLIQIYNEAFSALKLEHTVLKVNHRKFLEALVDELKLDFPVARFTTTLDKLDKIGEEGVIKELQNLGVDADKCSKLFNIIGQSELTEANLQKFAIAFNNNELAMKAVSDLSEILTYLKGQTMNIRIELDLSLARGLDYYTGCIFEAIVPNSGMGSVSGGGRYDDLTGVFGLKDVSGVGISFGVDRIYEILESSELWPKDLYSNSTVLLCHFDEASQQYAVGVAQKLRAEGISAMVFPDSKRINKQFDFANKAGIKYAIVIGDNEIKTGELSLKNLLEGSQENLTLDATIEVLKH